jgi:hypothetical protein
MDATRDLYGAVSTEALVIIVATDAAFIDLPVSPT